MRWLTKEEQEAFRTDYQDKEREIQRNFNIYLSGLVVVVGWIIGPNAKSLLSMLAGNAGYNGFALLYLIVLNVIFTCFLLFKSLNVHETMQFMILFSDPEGAFANWEAWRRSEQSATKPARPVYMAFMLGLPLSISAILLFGLARALWATRLLDGHWTSLWVGWWSVTLLHAVPLWVGFLNVGPTSLRWRILGALKVLDGRYYEISRNTVAREEPALELRRLSDGAFVSTVAPEDAIVLAERALLRNGIIDVDPKVVATLRKAGVNSVLTEHLTHAIAGPGRVLVRLVLGQGEAA